LAKFLTIKNLMERYDLSRSTILNLANDGILPSYRPSPRKILFPQDGIIEYEERHIRKGKKREQPKRKVLSVSNKTWRID
jgi:predicted DNA-binding transcriptional regulator AlpA